MPEATPGFAAELVALLKDYERWEADLFLSDEAWEVPGTPHILGELEDRMIDLQNRRNDLLDKAPKTNG